MAFHQREIRSAGSTQASGRTLKVYELVAPGQRIDDPLRHAARSMLPELVSEPIDATTPAVGWVVLHRGEDAAWVVAYSWVWKEVLEQHLAVAGCPELGAGGSGITDFGILDKRWMGCVWELAPLEHERRSWIDHVLRPTTSDVAAYLRDRLPDGSY
jgi:hypothetical protein